MTDSINQLAEIINRGFEWVNARRAYRRILDSKSASKADLKRVQRASLEASTRLEKAFVQLMRTSGSGPIAKTKDRTLPVIDWAKIAGVISKGAGVVEDVLNKKNNYVHVIDTEGKEVK